MVFKSSAANVRFDTFLRIAAVADAVPGSPGGLGNNKSLQECRSGIFELRHQRPFFRVAGAFRVPGKLDWDSKTMSFPNSPEATKLVRPVVRPGWELTL